MVQCRNGDVQDPSVGLIYSILPFVQHSWKGKVNMIISETKLTHLPAVLFSFTFRIYGKKGSFLSDCSL